MDGTDPSGEAATFDICRQLLAGLEKAVRSIAQATDSQRAYDALLRSAYNADSEMGKRLGSRYANLPILLIFGHSASLADRVNAMSFNRQPFTKEQGGPKQHHNFGFVTAKQMMKDATTASRGEPLVRQMAVRSLGNVGDREDRKLLQQIAQSDAASHPSSTHMRYPVREEASGAIQNWMAIKELS